MPPISTKTDKPKDTGRTLRRLLGYLLGHRIMILIAFLFAIVSNLLSLVGPYLSGKAIDIIAVGKGMVDFDKVFYYAGIMVAFYILSGVISYLLSSFMIIVGRKVSKQLRREVFDKLMVLPIGFFDTHQTGDIISRVSYDIDVINTSVSTDITQILTSIITVVLSFAMMLVISPKLIIVVIITIPLSIAYTSYMTKKTRPLFSRRSRKYGELNGFSEEMFSGQKTIQAYAHEEGVIDDFSDINSDAAKAYYDADYLGTKIGPSVGFINNLSLALVAVFGSVLYLYNAITVGKISSFVLYSRKFSGPINEIANMFNEILSALAAAERVFKILDEPEELADLDEAVPIEKAEGDVRLDNVCFGYDTNKMILKNINLVAKPGSVIAIVGPTGAGKTTIINLLMRFYDIDSGCIHIDGCDIRKLTRTSLRKQYTMVLQDTWVFNGTISDNIAYAKEDASLDEVIAAAKAARLHSYIMRLPHGYNTVINENGNNISKGQKQLLTIARAMLDDSGMLILDEATSNVDTRTEKKIQKAMLELMRGKTCFVIAHRLSTIRGADCILVVDDGRIVEQGTHEQLLARRGAYYNMYAAQYR